MRLTNSDRTAFVVTIAVLVYLFGAPQDPPRKIEPAPVQPIEPKEPKPTAIVFGETFQDVRVQRPKNLGTIETGTDPEDGRIYTLRYLGAGIREQPEGTLIPTDEEFAAWLASDSTDLQAFLEDLHQ